MNSKKANWLFLSVVLLHIVLIIVLVGTSQFFSLGIVSNLLVSQANIFLPALFVLFFGRKQVKLTDLGFRKVRPTTLLFTIIYTLLCMPLVTVVNAISMLFVENTVVSMSGEILAVPFPIMLLIIAGLGPLSEEVVFRGIVFSGYRNDGNALGAVLLSSLVFGLMHMNINQAGYAFVIGVALSLLRIATGSIWPAIWMHCLINAQSVCSMYLVEYFVPGSLASEAGNVTTDALFVTIGIYGILATVTTLLAICLLVWMAGREGGREELIHLRKQTESPKRTKRITLSLIVAIVMALIYMLLDAWLMGL